MEKNNNIIEQRCIELLEKALQSEASDIHLVPSQKKYDVLFKKDSKLQRSGVISPQLADRMISYYKFLSSLDISNKRKPQSGSFHKNFHGNKHSFRISTIPSIYHKESVVIRIQKHDLIISMDSIGIHSAWSKQLIHAVSQPQGIIFITGPTGCGKTTTMYALTSHCVKKLDRHVITLEDPVENNHSHLLQVQVNERAGMSYSAGLKAILRHSPDIIMIGEIRDEETAKVAIQAALTGHLVLTTVHAKNPIGCIYRMMEFGITLEELRQTLICIAAQRLIRQPNGNMGAVFEILQGKELEQVTEKLKKGERVDQNENNKIEKLVLQYSQPQLVNDD
jgi:competence protein ComGA